ncbi:transmembrane family of transporters domain-containing protein [Ditylenchus destructor]|nr:transmembrane family of transporters domain-containing protein [Ditylenchus destructor]
MGGSCRGWQLSRVAVVAGGSCRVAVVGWQLSGGSCCVAVRSAVPVKYGRTHCLVIKSLACVILIQISDLILGLVQAFISAGFFGSSFAPIKGRNSGDAIFVQWIMSIGILTSGFCILPIRNFPPFHPFAAVGGAMWAIGNALVLPVIHEVS